MGDPISISPETTSGSPDRPAACRVLLELAGPEVYRGNPFRLLNLPVLGGVRELAKRVDELKLAAEFGIGASTWSFGPVQALTSEEIRTAAQALKDPAQRLVREFFWFWPDHYPDDKAGDDAALGHLARGETAHAVELWQGAAMQGQLVALHNLAVYYHLQALEMEQQEAPPADELIQLWFKALRFWEKIGGAEELWSRLCGRVGRLADARLKEEFVVAMRVALPEALARICAVLALTHARQGRGDRAALQAALITHVHGDTTGARRALEEYAAPIARRIDARANEAKQRIAGAAAAGLDEAMALLRHCDEDLRLIELLCGRTVDYFVEVSNGLADVAHDGVVGYQRETQDDFGCLPVLLHLLDMEAAPELKGRVQETFDTVYRNALAGGSRPPIPFNDEEGEVALDEARAFQLIVDQIVPGLEVLGLGAASRDLYAARAAMLLKDLAVAAGVERDDIELASRAFAAALSLPVSETLRESLESDLAQLQRDFETRKEKELQVECGEWRLIIDRYGVCLNDCRVAPDEVVALRYGQLPGSTRGVNNGGYVIAWRSLDGEEFELNADNLLPASSYVEEHYTRILDSLHFYIIPGLVDRLVGEIRAGHELLLGSLRLGLEGAVLTAAVSHFWKRNERISYARLQTVVEAGRLIVSNRDNPRQSEAYDAVQIWNAAVIGYVVEVLARE